MLLFLHPQFLKGVDQMASLSVRVVSKEFDTIVYGVYSKSNDKQTHKDIPIASKKYYKIINKKEKEVFPYFVLSKNYDQNTRNFDLFVGNIDKYEGLEKIIIPKGLYGVITIKPKLGFMWGLSIGEAKKNFYKKWLPKTNYEAINLEFEYHEIHSIGKNPNIDIYFGITKPANL